MSSPSHPSRLWRRILLALAIIFTVSVGLIAFSIYQVVTPSREVAGWRKTFLSANAVPCSTTIQLSAGPWLLAVVRLVASQINDIPPEALVALRSVRSASVGVYQLARPDSADAAALGASDERMLREGWRRAVGVRDGRSAVLIYTPKNASHSEELKICLAVLDGSSLVLVSGTIAGRDLVPLISREMGRRRESSRLVEQI